MTEKSAGLARDHAPDDLSSQSDWMITWRQFRKNRIGITGLIVVYVLFAIAIFAPVLANGLPFYLRGVVTLFFDSDVTAWKDLDGKIPAQMKLIETRTKGGQALERDAFERERLRLERMRAQIRAIVERLAEVLPEEELGAFEAERPGYLAALDAEPKAFDAADFKERGRRLEQQLSTMTYRLAYKLATNALYDIKDQGLRPMQDAAAEFSFLEEDEEEARKVEARRYAAGRALVAEAAGRLDRALEAMTAFLIAADRPALEELRRELAGLLAGLPGTVPAEEGAMDDPVSDFERADARFAANYSSAKVTLDLRSQRLPARTYWPLLRNLGAGEVFFLALFLTGTGLIIGFWRGFIRPSGRAVLGCAVAPSVAIAVLWGLAVPSRNPPPDSYYKQFYEDLKLRRKAFETREKAGEKDLPDPGSILFAPIPYGENENIAADAKVPPTWAEPRASMRRRLLSREQRVNETITFTAPGSWIPVDAAGERLASSEGARRFRLPAGGPELDLRLRVFRLSGSDLDSQLAKTVSEWRELFSGTRGPVREFPTGFGRARAIEADGPGGRVLAISLDWKPGDGPKGGPWGLECVGSEEGLRGWRWSIESFFGALRGSMDPLIDELLDDPTRIHWLGTDENGRDISSRMAYGARISLSVGFIAVAIYVVVGIIIGALAGFFGGWTDIAISRFIEIVICFPSFFLIITVLAMLPPSIVNIMVVLGLTRWTGVSRLIRGEFLRLVNLDFVVACRAMGFSPLRIIFRHIVPNALAPVLVAATFGVAGAILTESALSFLGFGVPQPQASWGSILKEASSDPKQLWWITMFPGLAIFVTITAYNIVGEAFRDASDPRLRK